MACKAGVGFWIAELLKAMTKRTQKHSQTMGCRKPKLDAACVAGPPAAGALLTIMPGQWRHGKSPPLPTRQDSGAAEGITPAKRLRQHHHDEGR